MSAWKTNIWNGDANDDDDEEFMRSYNAAIMNNAKQRYFIRLNSGFVASQKKSHERWMTMTLPTTSVEDIDVDLNMNIHVNKQNTHYCICQLSHYGE